MALWLVSGVLGILHSSARLPSRSLSSISAYIDELPQLFNVVRGDMSLVGPRPEREEFVEIFKEKIPQYMQKHLVKAGITGWAQVQGYRGDTDLNLRIKEDIWYIEHYSLWLDIKILFLTVIHLLVYAITNRRNKV